MPLSSPQIERYSRQIILENVGGTGQERLLASHIAIVGAAADVELAFRYLAGAGVGRINLQIEGEVEASHRMVERARNAIAEVAVSSEPLPQNVDLILALVGNSTALELGESLAPHQRGTPLIWARLDTPARIAIISASPPCLCCAQPSLLTPWISRSEFAGFVAMNAVSEALKWLIGNRAASATLIEFDGYQAQSARLEASASDVACGCRAARRDPGQ
jgi:hypothetical protein